MLKVVASVRMHLVFFLMLSIATDTYVLVELWESWAPLGWKFIQVLYLPSATVLCGFELGRAARLFGRHLG